MKESSIIGVIIIIMLIVGTGIFFFETNSTPNYNQDNSNTNYYGSFNGASNNLSEYDSTLINDYNRFYFDTLNDTQKAIYIKLLNGFNNFEEKIKLDCTVEDFCISRNALDYDHPEFFWTSSFSIATNSISKKIVEVSYIIPFDAHYNMQKIIDITDEILADAPSNPAERMKYIYDWIVFNTDYGDSENSQEITSVFFDGVSVCAGYSKAFQYLCQKSNIVCSYVGGFTNKDMSHAWNLVKLNDNYYWVDVTWGDPIFAGMKDNSTNYNYFLVSDKDFLRNHIVDKYIRLDDGTTYSLNVNYPICSDDSLNYYNLKGCYFSSYNKQDMENYIKTNLKNGVYKNIDFKFSNEDDYRKFVADFMTGEKLYVFDVIRSTDLFYGSIQIKYGFIDSANYACFSIISE